MSQTVLPNPNFTTNADGWTLFAGAPSSMAWSATGGDTDPGCILFSRGSSGSSDGTADNGSLFSQVFPAVPGRPVTASSRARLAQGSDGTAYRTAIRWHDANGGIFAQSLGVELWKYQVGSSSYNASSITVNAPANAAGFSIGSYFNSAAGTTQIYADNFTVSHDVPTINLEYPLETGYEAGVSVPFRITYEGTMTIGEVRYYIENVDTSVETLIGTATTAPWGINVDNIPSGDYIARAEVVLSSGTVLNSNEKAFNVGDPVPPETREFKASNSYTYLVNKNFVGLTSAIPPTAQIVGARIIMDYKLQALIRSKDVGIADLTTARYEAAFQMAPSVTFAAALLEDSGTSYTALGSDLTAQEDVLVSDFSVVEDGTSEGKRWTVLDGDPQQVSIGGEDSLFGLDTIPAGLLNNKSIGVRMYPNLGTKPEYADTGDACYRVAINKLRFQLYFDAGSVEYYFVSPDETNVIKGFLVSANVSDGGFATGDAKGVLQIGADLEIVDGNQNWIGNDWTIHAAYPPSSENQIGTVGNVTGKDEEGMVYNGLATQREVLDNRSRYLFITANFYGDRSLNSIYGVNGVDRAFAYNDEWFYKIYTTPDPAKDMPRHVAYHHWHLALGYDEGRVDMSVVGEPYNYDGVLGASSHTIGDKVVGLLPLSGTILGVFGSKSVWGIAGTTVDNFATQVISPNIGAIEYTICDMGFPVYANSYGIYTLSQTQQYGDYMGSPMSQDISPWLRPRLVRKYTSDREVVVAWPVRTNNQYRLAFKDGFVVTMTLNGQQVPTFSKQKYFYEPRGMFLFPEDLYEYPAIVPAAVSSQLDEHGQERIHTAPIEEVVVTPPVPQVLVFEVVYQTPIEGGA